MKEPSWQYEKRDINDLIENKNNPRRLSKKKAQDLKDSIERFGVCQPLVIQPNGQIIGGHQRLKTFKQLGISEIPVLFPSRELTQEEENELVIRLNKNLGDWDFDILANCWDIDLLYKAGFTEEELHSDVLPKEKPKKFTITLKFENEEDLRAIEKELENVSLNVFEMKVRCK